MRSIKKVLADKHGISEIIGSTIGLLVLAIALVLCIAGIKLVNEYTTLNEFGEQLVRVVSDYGQCGGTTYIESYQKLVETTTLSPEVSFTTEYFNAATKKVQYGEPIKLVLKWESKLGYIPITMNITKIGRSEQYWK